MNEVDSILNNWFGEPPEHSDDERRLIKFLYEPLRKIEADRAALLEALRALVQNEGLEPYSYLDKGIGTATAAGQRWLNARAVIAAAKGEENN